MKLYSLTLIFLLLGCATNSEAWYEVTIDFKKQKWRLCTKEKDGIEKHLKGLCYIGKTCRSRRFRSRVCKPLPKFCAFNNKECLTPHAYSGKVLMRKGL